MLSKNENCQIRFSQPVESVTLSGYGITLAPLCESHATGISQAASDGQLWNLRVTSVPEPENTAIYISNALQGKTQGHMLPFVVINESNGQILGSTRYHDILPEVARLEIGYTWYAKSAQKTHVNTVCKLLLLTHAFETLEAKVVGWRTDNFNFASQKAIERLGAHKDGIVRGHALRRDGTIRDTVMYSLTHSEWPDVRAHLKHMLALNGLE